MGNRYIWYSKSSNIDSPDTIHQILAYGTLKDVLTLERQIGQEKLGTLFINYPKKVYTAPALNFVTKFIIHLSGTIKENEYLKTTPRNIG